MQYADPTTKMGPSENVEEWKLEYLRPVTSELTSAWLLDCLLAPTGGQTAARCTLKREMQGGFFKNTSQILQCRTGCIAIAMKVCVLYLQCIVQCDRNALQRFNVLCSLQFSIPYSVCAVQWIYRSGLETPMPVSVYHTIHIILYKCTLYTVYKVLKSVAKGVSATHDMHPPTM